MSLRRLFVFSPLPPQPNGLADYLLAYLPALAADFDLTLVAEMDYAAAARAALPGLHVIDEMAFLAQPPQAGDQVLYNLGNNPDCTYMLDYTARFAGALLLHDPALLYLHQVADRRNWSERLMGQRLAAEGHTLPQAFLSRDGRLTASPGLLYQECLLLRELASAMHGVLVHSRYAVRRLAGAGHPHPLPPLTLVPHFALTPPPPSPAALDAALAPLGIAPTDRLLLVPGFLSGNKMLYEVLVAHHALATTHPQLKLVFAGQARPQEYDLAARIAALWPAGGGPQITGYLDADALDVLLARADICCVLRHPTYGESSGLLPRAATSGAAVVTVDTGAYAELEWPALHRIPVGPGATAALTQALATLLAEAGGDAARQARRDAAALPARNLAPAALYPSLRAWLDGCHAAAQPGTHP